MLVLTKNMDQAQAVAKSLSAATGRRVTYGTEWWHGAPPFLHVDAVGTHNCRSCLDWRFLILWDAELLLSGTAMTQVLHTFSISLGFLTHDETSLNEMDRATIESILGEVIYRPGDEVDYTHGDRRMADGADVSSGSTREPAGAKEYCSFGKQRSQSANCRDGAGDPTERRADASKLGIDEPARTCCRR